MLSTHSAFTRTEVLSDYKTVLISRNCSLIGRKEVLNGRAKFGIFGDGKELAQVAMAKAFRKGDWRSGYYRDQTLLIALGILTPESFFAQLYADTNPQREPASRGRQMNCHFATRFLDDHGQWLNQQAGYNISADVSPTGGQMARLLGLAYASKLYKRVPQLQASSNFSRQGDEIAFGTIGNASAAEGVFWESVNAAGVLQIPYLISVWDDGYGISVPNSLQMTRGSIFELMQGFGSSKDGEGYHLFSVAGHDYEKLVETYKIAQSLCRKEHKPCLVHVHSMTQPQGHSTSGSHERYKNAERLEFEKTHDGITRFREWILSKGFATEKELASMEEESLQTATQAKESAWKVFQDDLDTDRKHLLNILKPIQTIYADSSVLSKALSTLSSSQALMQRTLHHTAMEVLFTHGHDPVCRELCDFVNRLNHKAHEQFNSHLLDERKRQTQAIAPTFSQPQNLVDGRQVIQAYFDHVLAKDPRVFIIGEDVGMLGGVNLEFEGLQQKHGDLRVTDTGIREATILGQGIGCAMRGLRPVVDIQYLDYLIYALQGLSDDLATLRYRTAGGQAAPVIVRTKGHRLEGIWHTGSPIGMILGSCRGTHLCVPRNATQAVGMYQTLLQGDDPGIVIEVLNGYRKKESLPTNLGQFAVPLGQVEVLKEGTDITMITYGAMVDIALHACRALKELHIDVELIDVQTLLPFDTSHTIAHSVSKTNALVCLDEDVPGGASAYMMQQVLEVQRAYEFLDSPPLTITSKPHRSPYGSDGDYFSKPNHNDIVLSVYQLMRERDPQKYPPLAQWLKDNSL